MKEELRSLLLQAMANKGVVFGTFFGFLVGVAALYFGLLKALVFAFFIGSGYYVGHRLDSHRGLMELVERFFPPAR